MARAFAETEVVERVDFQLEVPCVTAIEPCGGFVPWETVVTHVTNHV